MPAAARRDAGEGGGDFAIACDELGPQWKAVNALDRVDVDVEHPDAGDLAGRNTDHRVREACPPRLYLRFVTTGILEAVNGERTLVVGVTRKYWNAQHTCVMQRRVEHGRDVVDLMHPVIVRAHSILPPNR